MADNSVSKSWFAVLANPEDHGYSGTPQEICVRLKEEWISGSDTRTGAWAYCVSADGLHHIHMVLEDAKAMRFSGIKKTYAVGMHFEATQGSKAEAEAYIEKKPPFDEKGEQVLCVIKHGEIQAASGHRSDLDEIDIMIESGLTPSEIFRTNFNYRKYERMIKSAYFDKRKLETPVIRQVIVHYLVGASGSGKSYTYKMLCDEHGEDAIYHLTDYSSGGFDYYEAQPILFVDEFKGQWPYSFLLSVLDVYKTQVHARYSNSLMLWTEVYLTSIYPLETLYEILVPPERRKVDSYQQLLRRLTDITYCFVDEKGNHGRVSVQASEYSDYLSLQALVNHQSPPFYDLPDDDSDNPFV